MTASLLTMTDKKYQRLSHACILFSLFLLGAIPSWGSTQTTPPHSEGIPILALAPAFLRPPVYRYLLGSQRTIIYPALLNKDGMVEPLDGTLFKTPEDWDHFIREARERSLLQLATLDPTFVRDSHGIIQMAMIISASPLNASCILTPGFLQHFSAIFGPELLIIIPTQNKICVFPKLANHLSEMSELLRDDYLISPIPASTEIFELSAKGLHAVGTIDPNEE